MPYPDNVIYFGQEIATKISLKKEFKVERKAMRCLPENHDAKVYLNAENQRDYQVQLSEDNSFINSKDETVNGNYNFVLTCEDSPKLLCDINLNHSYLANGKKILAAGCLIFNNGRLETITNNSGHYRPTNDEMLAVIKALHSASKGSLKTYISYCKESHELFPVAELVDHDNFSSITPLSSSETINSTGQRQPLGDYDLAMESDNSERRFGRQLALTSITNYQKILNYSIFCKPIENKPIINPSECNIKI